MPSIASCLQALQVSAELGPSWVGSKIAGVLFPYRAVEISDNGIDRAELDEHYRPDPMQDCLEAHQVKNPCSPVTCEWEHMTGQ